MTIQEAAYQILKELGEPISSKKIASIALDKHMVSSNAHDPIQSHAQTIEKNIRDDVYNRPKLIFMQGSQGRLIGLPEWSSGSINSKDDRIKSETELKARIPGKLLEKIRLAEQAKLTNSFDETVSLLLTRGLSSLSAEIRKGLMEKLDALNSL
jgi:hypothetical protein